MPAQFDAAKANTCAPVTVLAFEPLNTNLEIAITGSIWGQTPAAPHLLQVVALVIVKSLKINLLETFDSSQGKLQAFFSQVELFFYFNADRFTNKEYKVLFASLYL